MAKITVSKRFNSLAINDKVIEEGKKYKVVGIQTWINKTGGTDYILEEEGVHRFFDWLRKK